MKDYEKLSKKHFDHQAPKYDDSDSIFYSKIPKISCEEAIKIVNNLTYNKFLDIGCGTGYLIDKLRKNSDAVFYGLDISTEMLKIARQKLGDTVFLVEGSASTLPYDDNVFDVVTCIQSFHHYPQSQKAMEEAFRVTAKGGHYIISETSPPKYLQWWENHLIAPLLNTGDYSAYYPKDIEEMMKQAGFKIESSERNTKSIFTVVGIKE